MPLQNAFEDLATEAKQDSQNESLVLLRRIVKLLESQATVDVANRQRITLDAITAALTLATVTTVSTVTNVTNVAGMNQEQYINIARNTFANSIRSKLNFT